jgi:hypothetical protein
VTDLAGVGQLLRRNPKVSVAIEVHVPTCRTPEAAMSISSVRCMPCVAVWRPAFERD